MDALKLLFVNFHEAWFKYCPLPLVRNLGGYVHAMAYVLRILRPSWKEVDGIYYYLDTRDFVQRTLFKRAIFEPEVLKAIISKLPADGVFLDIGTNIGLMSLPAAKYLQRGRVISIEPGPAQLALLRNHIKYNGLSNITVVPKGFGAERSDLELFISARSNGGRNSLSATNADSSSSVRIEIVRGDDELQSLGVDKVHVIKLDIEGAEANALRGLTKTINRDKPVIIIEIIEQSLNALGSSEKEVRDLIHNFGYTNSQRLDHANIIFW